MYDLIFPACCLFLPANEPVMMKDSPLGQVSCLPEDCIGACACAKSIFTDLHDRVMNGNITVTELETISERQEYIRSLCAAVYGDTEDSAALKISMGYRMAEFEALHRHIKQLDVLCRFINLRVTGT